MDLTHTQKIRTLYKIILKLHKGLPQDLQLLGNNYAREEFKRHKQCNAEEAKIFVNEWSMYALKLSEQLGLKGTLTAKKLGSALDDYELKQFREDQLHQLYELKLATEAQENKKPD